MRARLGLKFLLAVALVGATVPYVATHAQAAEPPAHPGVSASVDPCVPVDAAEFHRVLALELGPDVAYASEAPAAGAAAAVTHVRIACVESGIELRLEDPVTRKSMTRVLSLEALPDRSRTRLLALAAAEFVVASWIELNIQSPVVQPAAPPPSAQAREAVAAIVHERHPPPASSRPPAPATVSGPPAWQLSGSFTGQLWTSLDGVLLGGGLRVLHRQFEHLAWALGADFGTAKLDVAGGRVSLTNAGAAAALLARGGGRRVRVYAGPGARAGIARMEGVPDPDGAAIGTGFFAPMLGPIAYARIEVELSDYVFAGLDAEAGLVTMPARALAGDRTVLELDGAWFTGGLALAAAF